MDIDPHPPPAAPIARIPARTRRQAMDWSLVLASQGIEPIIEKTEDGCWELIVGDQDYENSITSINQYRRENLGWPWRRTIFQSRAVFDWGSTAWVMLMVVFFWLDSGHANLRSVGAMDGAAVAHGEWWRVFTATLLHADLAHLAANAVFGFMLLGLAMGRYGTGLGLLAAFLAGAAGNVASWLVRGPPFYGLGASGVIMGGLGLVSVSSFASLRQKPKVLKLAFGGAVGGLMLFVLLGLSPGTDVVAHFGGFVAGVGLGLLLNQMPRFTQGALANFIAGFLLAVLVIGSWALALGLK